MFASPARPFRLIAAAAVLSLGLGLSACSSGDAPAGTGLNVVTTTTQLADFARVIGGDRVTVTSLMEPGGSAHHFDPTPADLLTLGSADVLVVNGAGLESFVDDAVQASGFDGALVDASDGLDLDALAHAAEEHADHDHADHDHADHDHADHDHADHDHADHDHADHDHAEEAAGHEGHDHGPVNPHLWTAPLMAADLAAEVGRGLAAADPAGAADYTANAAAYGAQLGELDAWVRENVDRVPAEERLMVSGHNALEYYLEAYDITFVGSILPSFEDNAEPSAAEIDALLARISEAGVRAIFVESSMSPKLAAAIGRDAGVEVISDDVLYADSLGAPGSPAEHYVGATIANTTTILETWGVTVSAVPDSLS